MSTKEFSEWLSDIDGIEVIKVEEDKVIFVCLNEDIVLKLTTIAQETKNLLSILNLDGKICFCLYNNDLQAFVKKWSGENKKGIPDLSWVTIKQMAAELKKRDNLTFALIWMEDSGYDNISLEGSGNPTVLCGILSRGLNLAIRHADNNIEYKELKDD